MTCDSGHVTELDLEKNNINGNIPSEIGNLINLTALDLSDNQLSSLPSEIENLTNLKILDLRYNKWNNLPLEIFNLTNLTGLQLDGYQLGILPPEIANLTNLISLGLSGTQLSSLPPEIINLSNLIDLNLEKNQLSTLSSGITNLINLQFLNLGDNQLGSLPPEIANLTKLSNLILNNNQLRNLPQQIDKLTNLIHLNLGDNQLSSLPPEIKNLISLRILDLSDNQLLRSPLPAYLTKFKKLNTFHFNDSGLCEPRDKTFLDWLSNVTTVSSTNMTCLYLVLTHELGYTIDDIDIQTYLDNNDVLYTPLYDDTRGNSNLKYDLGISRSYLLEASPSANTNLLQELRSLSEVEDCTYNENLQPDRHIELYPDDPALPQYFYPDFFDQIGETGYWKASRYSDNKVLTAVIDNFRSLVSDQSWRTRGRDCRFRRDRYAAVECHDQI